MTLTQRQQGPSTPPTLRNLRRIKIVNEKGHCRHLQKTSTAGTTTTSTKITFANTNKHKRKQTKILITYIIERYKDKPMLSAFLILQGP